MLFLKSYLLAISIVLWYLISADGSTCVYDACRCAYRVATCRNLSSIPPLVADSGKFNITHLMFYTGSITFVGDNSLPANLSYIQFSGNPITNVSRNAFQASSNTLNYLYFRGAMFTKLPDALLDLQNLKSLAVYDARITDWNTPVLQHINKTLISLNVEEQTSWPNWITELTSLQNIYVSDSDLSSIPDNAFSNVINSLEMLDLVNDSFHIVPKAISQLNLTSFSLSGNFLSDAAGIPRAQHMDLSFNALSDADKLVAALKPIGARIETLYLESNGMTVIPAFENVELVHLILSDNQIADHTKGSLPQSLIMLSLSKNQLTLLPTMVTNLPNIQTIELTSNLIRNISTTMVHQNLKYLYLSDNKISQLLSSDFPVNSSLRSLYVDANPIVNIPPDAFKNLQNLTDLSLAETNLTGVPYFLTPLVNLLTLTLDNIPGLTCACPRDEALVKWFSSGKLKSVTGNCSIGVNIKDFYNETDTTRCGDVRLLSSLRCVCFCFLVLLLLHAFSI